MKYFIDLMKAIEIIVHLILMIVFRLVFIFIGYDLIFKEYSDKNIQPLIVALLAYIASVMAKREFDRLIKE